MKRIAAIAAIALCIASPSLAEEVLYCTDTDVSGFVFETSTKTEKFSSSEDRFTVKVISKTKREIQMSGSRHGVPYVCNKRSLDNSFYCNIPYDRYATVKPFLFYDNRKYRRSVLDVFRIYIAYGTCTKF